MGSREDTAVELARVFAGEDGVKIVKYLINSGEVIDEKMADDLKMQVGTVRRILYTLQDRGIVSCRIERNSETGWITYYWFVPLDQINGILYNIKRRIIARIEKRLEYESSNVFYWCGNKECPKVPFSEAVDSLFRCPRCGRHLKPYDNSKLIAALKWALSKLKAEVEQAFES